MTDKKESYKVYLFTFVNQEVMFFFNKQCQEEACSNADEERFGNKLTSFFAGWDLIKKYHYHMGLSDRHLKMIENLYDMLCKFVKTIDLPKNSPQFRFLIYKPEWKEIQLYAKELYETVYPTL